MKSVIDNMSTLLRALSHMSVLPVYSAKNIALFKQILFDFNAELY